MRKLIILGLMAATAVPSVASAQSRGEIRQDRREVREQREDLRDARRSGDRRDIQRERRDLQDARQELREDRRDRRNYVRYTAPYRNWNYSPVRIGFQLRPNFYSQRYYIGNPVQYRLPRAGRFQQWIRYGDDLLLVNVRTGRVLRVLPGRYGY